MRQFQKLSMALSDPWAVENFSRRPDLLLCAASK